MYLFPNFTPSQTINDDNHLLVDFYKNLQSRIGGMQERRDSRLEGFGTGGIQDCRDSGLEGGLEGFRTGGMQERRDSGLEVCRTGGIQD